MGPTVYHSQLQLDEDTGVAVDLRVVPGSVYNSNVCERLSSGNLRVAHPWNVKNFSPLVALHILSQGTGPVLKMLPSSAQLPGCDMRALERLHRTCLKERQGLLLRCVNEIEIVLAPLNVIDGNENVVLFWGYRIPCSFRATLFDIGQLPLILDLDETVVMGHTAHSMKQKMASLEQEIKDITRSHPEQSHRLASKRAQCEWLEKHVELLDGFRRSDSVLYDGELHKAVFEEVVDLRDGCLTQRPVIRLTEQGVFFTQIIPGNKTTSMIICIRPGWAKFKKYLENSKHRWQISICTTAEREYALEVWRLLDSEATLLPIPDRSQRIVNVSRDGKKSLLSALQVGVTARPISTMPTLSPTCIGVSGMPFSLVLDDRPDVWEEQDRQNVHEVKRFANPPWRAEEEEREMTRLTRVLRRARRCVLGCQAASDRMISLLEAGITDKDKMNELVAVLNACPMMKDVVQGDTGLQKQLSNCVEAFHGGKLRLFTKQPKGRAAQLSAKVKRKQCVMDGPYRIETSNGPVDIGSWELPEPNLFFDSADA